MTEYNISKMPALPVQQHPPDLDEINDEPMELDLMDYDEHEDVPVLDEVQLDLESFVAPYHGLARVQRLEFVADHCISLRPLALDMAIQYFKKTSLDIKNYKRLFNKLETALVPLSEANKMDICETKFDYQWIESKNKKAIALFSKLDAELKSLRTTCMKENLRRAQEDLANYYIDCGELQEAYSSHSKALEYTNSRNSAGQHLNIIRTSILMRRWTSVGLLRAQLNNHHHLEAPCPTIASQLQCAAGLYEMHHKHYKNCASHLLSTNFEHFEPTETNILAPINILIYGGLCALATYSRAELASQLINSATFRQFSELDYQIRDAVGYFYESKFGPCLEILQAMKNTFLLDMYLAPHVETLLTTIRNRALVQYFEPYSSACLRKMAASFTNVSLGELERELVNLICDGHLRARIDSSQKILYASKVDSRSQIFERAIDLGKTWQRQAHALISRTAILNAGLRVGKRSTFGASFD